MPDPPINGKDLQDFQELPRSPLISYIARAAEEQKNYHYVLAALEPRALWQWITQYLGNRLGRRHKFETYDEASRGNGIHTLGDDSLIGGQSDPKSEIRMSLAGDWGTGTDEAAEVARMMAAFSPHYTIHLGDVYYVGVKEEVEENCLGRPDPDHTFIPCRWPWGSVGSFALNGNHEMYALGEAYFDVFLPTLGLRPAPGLKPGGQKASFFCLENEFWRVIGLDTGYNSLGLPILEYLFSPSCKLRHEELHWLKNKVNPKADKRGLILLTHHQYCSSFDREYPKTAQQLSALIDRPVLWFWGHEHRMAVYGKYSADRGIQAYGRCIGHGGMPVAINPRLKRPDRPLVAYDNRRYPSPENITVGYNGFTNLTFQGNQLLVEYRDLKNTLLLTENWRVEKGNLAGSVNAVSQDPKFIVTTGPIGLRFTETMRGYLSTEIKDDYLQAAAKAEQDHSPCEFTLTITSSDLNAMLRDPNHTAALSGTVVAPALSAQPMTVLRGEFHLFVPDPDQVETRRMRYRMWLAGAGGEKFLFDGFKVVHNDGVQHIWHDTSTLSITVFRGEVPESPVAGKGILHILPKDFLHQLTTIEATNAPSATERLKAEARFGRFFAGVLFDVYGGIFAKPTTFNPDAPPRRKRPLRVDAPEVHFFDTEDVVQLRLTRYQGGQKGPVVLLHGLGVSSLIFAIDTIETNLLEYLFQNGYDVWLLDFRASIDLPASATQFTADDVARKDYPAAISEVRRLTNAPSVQVVAHCYGATTFSMALCAGLEGVRSAVISQISTHIVPPTVNRIRTGLHLPDFLDKIGVTTLSAYVDTHENWLKLLYDKALDLYPVGERCQSPVCHRITFMYAPLYRHEQLNEATHEALHEMFGIANMRAFEGLALMTRKGHVVSAEGAEAYVPRMDRMAIPILFLHGEQNECFLPESTEITYNLLRQKNDPGLYARSVIPGYGHIDCIFGKNAATDIYPLILRHLEATAGHA